MMELLPPVGWAEVATKNDLNAQTALLRSAFRADLQSGLRQLQSKLFTAFLTLIGVLATMAGLLVLGPALLLWVEVEPAGGKVFGRRLG